MRTAPTLIAEALHVNARNHGCDLLAYCLMPDHLHVIALPPPIWQRSFWDRHLRPKEPLARLVRYVVHNPVAEGLRTDRQEKRLAGLAAAPPRQPPRQRRGQSE